MFYDLKDKKPKNSGENWVAPSATIIGDVTLEKNSSIWFNAVLRGDIEIQKPHFQSLQLPSLSGSLERYTHQHLPSVPTTYVANIRPTISINRFEDG